MYFEVDESELNPFTKCGRLVVCGFSNSGKSTFVSQIIRKYHSQFSKIIVLGGVLENVSDLNIEYNNNFNPLIDDDETDSNPPPKLVIFDDLIMDPKLTKLAANIFFRGRHRNLSIIFISHNLFYPDPSYRMISLNASHFCLFKGRDISQIERFSRTIFSKDKTASFVALYKNEVCKKPYGYIVIDLTKDPESPLSISTDIFSDYQRFFSL